MIALVGAALASPCTDGALPQGPLTVTILPGDLGRARSACLRTEVALGGGAALVVDTPDFYGRVQLMGTVDTRVHLPDTPVTVELAVEGFRSDQVIAPIAVSASGFGATTLGATVAFDESERGTLAVTGHLVLPQLVGARNQRPIGGDLGLVGMRQINDTLDFHGGIVLHGQRMVGPGPDLPRTALLALGGLAWHPTNGFALVLDMPASVAWDAPFDYLALAPGARIAVQSWALEVGVMAPITGANRTLVAADLRTSIRFD